MTNRVKFAFAVACCSGLSLLAASSKFSEFTALTTSAAPLPIDGPEEATPIVLSNQKWSQRTVADRRTQNTLVPNSNSGSWDMITSNETGPDAGRYVFMPFETGTAGVQRVDLQNPDYETRTVTIVAPGEQGFVSGDASRWAPWGGYLTAEESWGAGSTKGRLFEVRNPITAGPDGGDFVWRTIVPRVAHEGLAFDQRSACSRRRSRSISRPAFPWAAVSETATISLWTPRGTSTLSKIATAGSTTTSGSPSI